MFDAGHILDIVKTRHADEAQGGGSLCVIVDGKILVDTQWGLADAQRGTPYTERTLQYPMSAFKGVAAAILALLIDRGQIDPARPVGDYWPEFATPEKRDVTVAQLMSHQAGLPTVDGGYSTALLNDRDELRRRLSAQAPLWEPGTGLGYHSWTFGNYADFLFEGASGKTMAELIAELRGLLGVEIYHGLPRERWDDAAKLLWPPEYLNVDMEGALAAFPPDSLMRRMMGDFPDTFDPEAFYNGEAIRLLPVPADNSFTNARGMAELYAFLVAGGVWRGERLCSAEAIAAVTREQVRGIDKAIGLEMAFGMGLQRPSAAYPFSSNPAAFGHAGAGGMIAFADPDAGLAFAYLPTNFLLANPDPRSDAIIAAVYAGLRG